MTYPLKISSVSAAVAKNSQIEKLQSQARTVLGKELDLSQPVNSWEISRLAKAHGSTTEQVWRFKAACFECGVLTN